MSAFGGLVLTNKGRNLQAKAETGVQLNFNRIAVGDGELGGSSIIELNNLINEVKSLSILKLKTLTGGKAVIGSTLSNQDIASGFYWREICVFAEDPDEGEILYCYGNAGVNAEYIPAPGGADIVEKYIDIVAIVGNVANVTATIDDSLVFATTKEFIGHVEDNTNPHQVDKAQVGLSNVDNVQQIPNSEKGQANGIATLDASGKVPAIQIPDSTNSGNDVNISVLENGQITVPANGEIGVYAGGVGTEFIVSYNVNDWPYNYSGDKISYYLTEHHLPTVPKSTDVNFTNSGSDDVEINYSILSVSYST